MNELKLVPETNELLSQVLPKFEFPEEVNLPELVNSMTELMLKYNGIGLSANQLGLSHRLFIMRTAPNITVCINPRLVDVGTEVALMEEGCLSYPGLHVKIKRAAHIKVRYQNINGEVITDKFTGLTARVFQHELDHMNGENFLDRAGKVAKDVALRKWNKLKKLNNLKRKFGYGR
jgi:peptide deformylase